MVSTDRVWATKLTLIHIGLSCYGPGLSLLQLRRWPFLYQGLEVSRASQPLAGLDTRIWSKLSLPVRATWVALRKTLLRTNGSHGRCTIYFARLISRPFICLRPSLKAMLRFENPLFVLPKTLQRFTFDFLRPENAMRSPSSRRPRFRNRKRFALSRVWHSFNPSY